jgi:hypothetical protein
MELAPALPVVLADRVQPQQVIINLVINGIEAMQSVTDRPRELTIRTHQDEARQVVVTLKDCGIGISAADADRLFNAFFTTKSSVARNRNRRSDGRDVGHQRDVWLRRKNCCAAWRAAGARPWSPIRSVRLNSSPASTERARARTAAESSPFGVSERLRIVSFSSLF